ncbi:MAG: AIR carboxylase family protein, partial [Nitrospira sp.]|nr:AIR carboxylase family protein [Nitrospira sp.]
STVQMPPGVPVATMAVGKAGAKNAALFAAQIMGLRNVEVRKKLKEYRKKVAAEVERKARAIEKRAQT